MERGKHTENEANVVQINEKRLRPNIAMKELVMVEELEGMEHVFECETNEQIVVKAVALFRSERFDVRNEKTELVNERLKVDTWAEWGNSPETNRGDRKRSRLNASHY